MPNEVTPSSPPVGLGVEAIRAEYHGELCRLQASFRRRRTETLVAWWWELNRWEWPAKIPNFEDRRIPGSPYRNQVMHAIAIELGWRTIKNGASR